MEVSTEMLMQVIGQKEVELAVLRQQVQTLQRKLKEIENSNEDS
jgi:uncharacterized coiled-coil protein SlyX